MTFARLALPEPTNLDAVSALPGAPVASGAGSRVTSTRAQRGLTRWQELTTAPRGLQPEGPSLLARQVIDRVVARVRPAR